MTVKFQHFGDSAFFSGLEILDNAKGAWTEHITNPAPSVIGLWQWFPCPTCQSWVDTRHTQYETTPTNHLSLPQPNQCYPSGLVYL